MKSRIASGLASLAKQFVNYRGELQTNAVVLPLLIKTLFKMRCKRLFGCEVDPDLRPPGSKFKLRWWWCGNVYCIGFEESRIPGFGVSWQAGRFGCRNGRRSTSRSVAEWRAEPGVEASKTGAVLRVVMRLLSRRCFRWWWNATVECERPPESGSPALREAARRCNARTTPPLRTPTPERSRVLAGRSPHT